MRKAQKRQIEELLKLFEDAQVQLKTYMDQKNSQSAMELLEEFYEQQNGRPMDQIQRDFARELMEQIWEGEA